MSQKIGRTALAYARVWHHVDVSKDSRTLGRLATSIATTLIGKHKPIYHHSLDIGDYVVVTNCKDLKISGKKFQNKNYWSHSTKPGHLKLTSMEVMAANKGFGELLKKAVSGMLPKNRLRNLRLERLKVYDGTEHPYKQNLVAFHDEQPTVKKLLEESGTITSNSQ